MITEREAKRVQFGIMAAIRLSYDYILRRIDRSIINIASVTLGIAFLSTLLMTDTLYRVYALAGGERLSIETYQYWLMLVAIIVCVVGVTNAMLISVFERYKEIGTMKCLGAMDRHILLLVLICETVQQDQSQDEPHSRMNAECELQRCVVKANCGKHGQDNR